MKLKNQTMHTTPKLLSVLLLLGTLPCAQATTVALNNWVKTGGDIDSTFAGVGATGFTRTFGTDTDGRYDVGALAGFGSRVTLSTTLHTIQFSLTVGNITATGAGSNNAFRIGFENDDAGGTFDALVHYVFGYGPGTRIDARFAGSSNQNNEFAYGTAFDANTTLGTNATRLATGNTVNLVATLTYLGDAGGGLHNYQAMIDWDGETHTSNTFTRNTDSWDKIYVLTNGSAISAPSDTYTVSNVQVSMIPEPASSALLIAGLGGLFLLRNRKA